METRNCLERVQDEDLTKQGRDDRRRSLQDGAHATNVEAPDLAVTNVDPRYEVGYLHDRLLPASHLFGEPVPLG
jgi:hypothetical protein